MNCQLEQWAHTMSLYHMPQTSAPRSTPVSSWTETTEEFWMKILGATHMTLKFAYEPHFFHQKEGWEPYLVKDYWSSMRWWWRTPTPSPWSWTSSIRYLRQGLIFLPSWMSMGLQQHIDQRGRWWKSTSRQIEVCWAPSHVFQPNQQSGNFPNDDEQHLQELIDKRGCDYLHGWHPHLRHPDKRATPCHCSESPRHPSEAPTIPQSREMYLWAT